MCVKTCMNKSMAGRGREGFDFGREGRALGRARKGVCLGGGGGKGIVR